MAPASNRRGAATADFYQGIHICHTFYGMKREPGECIFCQNLWIVSSETTTRRLL